MCPFAEIDGKVIASSTAIAHYVAKSYGKCAEWEACVNGQPLVVSV